MKYKGGKSLNVLGEEYKVSPVTIMSILKRNNIARRSYGESISMGLRGKPKSEGHRRKLSEAKKGKPISEEHRKNISRATKGKPKTHEVRQRMEICLRGHRVSEETKIKLSNIGKGRKSSEETREKMSQSHKGKKLSSKSIEKLRSKLKGKPSPLKGCKKSAEICKKISDGRKSAWAKVPEKERREKMLKLRVACGKKRITSIEKAVMEGLQQINEPFVFQQPFGHFVADFYLPKKNAVIEADGAYWHSLPGRKERDKVKDMYLYSLGIAVVRLTEKSINKDANQAINEGLMKLRKGDELCPYMRQKTV